MVQIPWGKEDALQGVIDLISMKAFHYKEETLGAEYEVADVPAELADRCAEAREQMVEAVAETDEELLEKYLSGSEISEQELKAAKQNITGGFPLQIDSNAKIVTYLAVIGFYDLPLDYMEKFTDRIDAVTRDQVRDAFRRRVHPDRLLTVLVGGQDTSSNSGTTAHAVP